MSIPSLHFHVVESIFGNRTYGIPKQYGKEQQIPEKEAEKYLSKNTSQLKDFSIRTYGQLWGPLFEKLGLAWKSTDSEGHTIYVNKNSFNKFIDRCKEMQNSNPTVQEDSFIKGWVSAMKKAQKEAINHKIQDYSKSLKNEDLTSAFEKLINPSVIKSVPRNLDINEAEIAESMRAPHQRREDEMNKALQGNPQEQLRKAEQDLKKFDNIEDL